MPDLSSKIIVLHYLSLTLQLAVSDENGFGSNLGYREKINLQDCAEFWFVYEARIPAHIKICAGIRNKVDRTKDKHGVDLFFS
ncbi:MAG: hypothetical protein PVI90_08885, partial [Desulfobacteraceae bacterium]